MVIAISRMQTPAGYYESRTIPLTSLPREAFLDSSESFDRYRHARLAHRSLRWASWELDSVARVNKLLAGIRI